MARPSPHTATPRLTLWVPLLPAVAATLILVALPALI